MPFIIFLGKKTTNSSPWEFNVQTGLQASLFFPMMGVVISCSSDGLVHAPNTWQMYSTAEMLHTSPIM